MSFRSSESLRSRPIATMLKQRFSPFVIQSYPAGYCVQNERCQQKALQHLRFSSHKRLVKFNRLLLCHLNSERRVLISVLELVIQRMRQVAPTANAVGDVKCFFGQIRQWRGSSGRWSHTVLHTTVVAGAWSENWLFPCSRYQSTLEHRLVGIFMMHDQNVALSNNGTSRTRSIHELFVCRPKTLPGTNNK